MMELRRFGGTNDKEFYVGVSPQIVCDRYDRVDESSMVEDARLVYVT